MSDKPLPCCCDEPQLPAIGMRIPMPLTPHLLMASQRSPPAWQIERTTSMADNDPAEATFAFADLARIPS